MLLGSAGLGIVVARNVLERRGEFGLLEAVGFTPRQLRRLVFDEHRWLIAGAVVLGAVSALVSVWPQFFGKAAAFPWGQVGILFGGVIAIGGGCAWAATRMALRGSQLDGLRSE
jgi:ABC-type antimicrobial peptide transport system permease subunit